MRPVSAARPCIEIETAGVTEHVAGRCFVSDEAAHIDIGIGISDINASDIAMARYPFASPQIDTALKAEHLAGGARISERLVVVVDLLAQEPAPDRRSPAGVQAIGRRLDRGPARYPVPRVATGWARRVRVCGRRSIAGAFMQGAKRRHPQLPGDRLDH